MIFGSVCSGIEAASCAWAPLGWRAAWLSETAPFPSAVLAARLPAVPNLGDFTKIGLDDGPRAGAIDLLVGGTPCQDFSVAGLRAGFAGERGNLTFEFVRLAERIRPRWLLWENVPGVLSSDGGGGFGAFLGGLGKCGYGFAYRVLDAQWFGVPQRRRRVFVVGYLGDWRPPAAVLFEPESLRGDPAPSGGTRSSVAATTGAGSSARRGWCLGDEEAAGGQAIAHALSTRGHMDPNGETYISHTLRGSGFDASEDGSGRGTPLIAFGSHGHGQDAGEQSPTLRSNARTDGHANGGAPPAVAIAARQDGIYRDQTDALDRDGYSMAVSAEYYSHDYCQDRVYAASGLSPAVNPSQKHKTRLANVVRRLTPRECERLQGFPDDWTLIEYKGKPAKDGPRYEAIGNSMAVPVIRWIGERIDLVERLIAERSRVCPQCCAALIERGKARAGERCQGCAAFEAAP